MEPGPVQLVSKNPSLLIQFAGLCFVLMNIFAYNSVVVGPPGKWVVRTNRSREEVWMHRELQAPVPWETYEHSSGALARTNAAYVKRTWTRSASSDGQGQETKAAVIAVSL